jgi:hypothetical protein
MVYVNGLKWCKIMSNVMKEVWVWQYKRYITKYERDEIRC